MNLFAINDLETNNLIKDGIQSNLSTISQNIQTIGTIIGSMNLQNNNAIGITWFSYNKSQF